MKEKLKTEETNHKATKSQMESNEKLMTTKDELFMTKRKITSLANKII